MERYLLLKCKAVKAGKQSEIKTTTDFIKCFKEHDEKVQRLLCELYMHNFVLEDDRDSHPGPFIGDIQFQAFLSFAANQLKWAKAHNNFEDMRMALTYGSEGSLHSHYSYLSGINNL